MFSRFTSKMGVVGVRCSESVKSSKPRPGAESRMFPYLGMKRASAQLGRINALTEVFQVVELRFGSIPFGV